MRFPKIKKLDIYIIKNFCLMFLCTFFVCLFVFMMQFLWRWVDDLIGKGLSMTVLAKFFYYSALTMIPTSLPLAVLLASLISFGNLGEKLELLAIRAAGISLIKIMRPLIIICTMLVFVSFHFQNVIGPDSFMKLYTLIWSMKQTSPELDIPEGAFYNEISGYNVYVKKKNPVTGTMYDMMIYTLGEGFDNTRIILADSGKLNMSVDERHLVLDLYDGEQFENLQAMRTGQINIPYRRETFLHKKTIIPFDGGFQIQDAGFLSANSNTKGLRAIRKDIDSMVLRYDTIAMTNYKELRKGVLQMPDKNVQTGAADKEEAMEIEARKAKIRQEARAPFDSLLSRLEEDKRIDIYSEASRTVANSMNDLRFKALIADDNDKQLAKHWAELHRKFSLALACLVFFFIGAPLGAIIRKGGLGIPVIVSVIIFIIYFIIDNTSYRMAINLTIPVWLGMWMSTIILAPIGAFITYKSNKDSIVFNIDAYKAFFRKLLGLRQHRTLMMKEVIIESPDYPSDQEKWEEIFQKAEAYIEKVHLIKPPSYREIFWKTEVDEDILNLRNLMEPLIEEMSNTRNPYIIEEMNRLPFLAVSAHMSPFTTKWKNIASGIFLPLGAILFFRIWRFRIRLLSDLRQIIKSSAAIRTQIEKILNKTTKK